RRGSGIAGGQVETPEYVVFRDVASSFFARNVDYSHKNAQFPARGHEFRAANADRDAFYRNYSGALLAPPAAAFDKEEIVRGHLALRPGDCRPPAPPAE